MVYGGGLTPEMKEQLRSAMRKHASGAAWAEEIQYVEVNREKLQKMLKDGAPPTPDLSAALAIEAMEELGICK